MARHTLKETTGPGGASRRWFVDGERVSFARFYLLADRAQRADCFQTQRVGARWHHSKVVTL